MKDRIVKAFRDYIIAEDAARKSPCGWLSCPPRDTPKWKEYGRLCEILRQAESALWAATDIEYDEDGFREHVWNWRYWKVMARKCCWSQRDGSTFWAGQTMGKLNDAEERLAKACGLEDLYRSPSSYIEEAFPKLKK